MSLIGALTKAAKAGEAAKKTAPFYSAVDEALANLKRPKGTGAEFYTELTKQAGVKKAELADRKLEQAFKAKGKMTKEEAQQVLADNPPPKLKEKVYDESTAIDEDDLREMVSQEMFGVPYSTIGFSGARHRQISDEVYRRMDADNGTKYGKYRTPNGENYREILLKLPEVFTVNETNRMLKLDADRRRGGLSPEEMQELTALQDKKRSSPKPYHTGHWIDDSNVLAHMRVQDRTGPNGEKILHVEEIQSDWHQEGRKQGYKSGNSHEKQWKNYQKELLNKYGIESEDRNLAGIYSDLSTNATPEEMARYNELKDLVSADSKGVPDAPFKKNWHELAMKRLLNYAADNGYDSIAITPGAEQAKRYDLSKQVGQISYTPSTKNLMAFDHQGNAVVNEANVKPEDLERYLGAGVTQKLSQAEFEGPTQVLRGNDISVGGEGMKGFYDKMLPDYLNTFGKPYGAQVQQLQIPIKHELQGLRTMGGYPEEPPLTMHNFPITPKMRESIKQKGLPLYQQVGIPTAGAGAASQMLEPPEEPEYSKGGSIAKMAALAKLKQMRGEMAPRAEAVKSLIARDQNSYLRDVAPNSLTNPEIEAEIKRMAARAKASGQQEGYLPLAEREANKAKYLEKSKEKNVMYHGTDQDISEFRPYTFVTPDPKVAHQYPDISHSGHLPNQNIMPVHIRAENPFDYEIPSHVHKLSSIIKDKQLLRDIKDGYWQSIESPDVLEAMQKLGFDSFYSPDMAKNIGVFKPEQIKSAIGNRGTYDINEREVNKAKGGLAFQEPKYGPGGAIAKMALKAAPAPKAPQIIKPSTLTELKKIVEKEKGGYGARRVERAADEVPNLEKMYTLDALKERFLGDNAKALMTMSPADFEKFATELQGKTSVGPKAAESAKQGEISKYTVPTNEYVKHLERIAMFDSVPYLNLAKEEVGLPLLPYVSGHEGRHRSRALAGKGEKRNLVGVTPTMDLREALPRRSQEEFIEAMKKELELSGGLVLPQSEPMLGGRPPIILPDVYAKGGSVKPKVKDLKSGKVKMTENRDTMFMELSNKKLKRK